MDRPRRLSLLVTSPRVAPGLLSHQAWQALGDAKIVFARGRPEQLTTEGSTVEVVMAAGIEVRSLLQEAAALVAAQLIKEAEAGPVIWIGSSDGDPGLADALAQEITQRSDAPELEMLMGSWDVPGSRLLDAVAVVDQLRSPGGCPWDAEQTHRSLTPYLIEEAYECVEALDSGDCEHMIEELGDVLLQVLFHARVGEEEDDGFDVDDVAGALVAKLIRRHPHVFAGGTASTASEVESSWQALKAAEKPEREHLLDGIPAGMPDLARASKVTGRLLRAGQGEWLAAAVAETASRGAEGEYASQLLDIVVDAQMHGVDPGAALRDGLRWLEASNRARAVAAD